MDLLGQKDAHLEVLACDAWWTRPCRAGPQLQGLPSSDLCLPSACLLLPFKLESFHQTDNTCSLKKALIVPQRAVEDVNVCLSACFLGSI